MVPISLSTAKEYMNITQVLVEDGDDREQRYLGSN